MTKNVLEWLDRSYENRKEALALADEHTEASYGELWDHVQRIGSYLGQSLGCRNQPIAVMIDRDICSLILFLGIAASGNFYVPIDPTLPRHRIELILQTLCPAAILKKDGGADREAAEGSLPVFFLADMLQAVPTERIDWELLREIRGRSIDTDPLYAIFTSGSTGTPKGVVISHRSVIDLVEQFQAVFPFPEQAVFGNQAPFDFDVSVKDIYNSLYRGAVLQVLPKRLFSMPVKLIEYLNERRVNTAIWAVSAMQIVANFQTFAQVKPEYLKLVMFSGEIMPVKVLNYWKEQTDACYVNLYGPTEITCNCSYYIVDREFEAGESLPIGKAFPNTQIFLWDAEQKEVITQAGKTGEICVRGTCLALGYYNNREKTSEAFTQSPFQSAYPEPVYHTGDMGSYDERGDLLFASRKDYQIKHMGHRIELGEIEVAALSLEYVENACCVYEEEKELIHLFYQAKEECRKQIIRDLAVLIPKYMLPNKLHYYPALPMNPHGKLDRALLKKTVVEKK